MASLLEHVEQTFHTRKLLARGRRALVAVSGGVDSVVLLHLLRALAAKRGWRLTVAHFNHQLRGRASEADERFVRSLAARLKLPCHVGRGDVRKRARRAGVSIEMAARDLRHRFLARAARRLGGATIATAHHADDQVELFFLRLLRGSGPEGLAGMKWRAASPVAAGIRIIRPLLDVSRAQLEEFARANKISFREDRSNASGDRLRNRVRRELLPLLRRRFQPALRRTVLRVMDILGAEADFVARATRARLARASRSIAGWPVALQRRAIQWELHRAGIVGDYGLIESLRRHPRRRITVSPGVALERTAAGRVRRITARKTTFAKGRERVELRGRAGEIFFDGVRIQWRRVAGGGCAPASRQPHQEAFDAGGVGLEIVLRHWQPGDRFQPLGLTGTVKLQDWFTNRKVPRARRRELVVATTAAGEIFWIEGERISERFKLRPETKRRLLWRWQRL